MVPDFGLSSRPAGSCGLTVYSAVAPCGAMVGVIALIAFPLAASMVEAEYVRDVNGVPGVPPQEAIARIAAMPSRVKRLSEALKDVWGGGVYLDEFLGGGGGG